MKHVFFLNNNNVWKQEILGDYLLIYQFFLNLDIDLYYNLSENCEDFYFCINLLKENAELY